MKFGQLIEYNMRNIFLQKSCIKYGGETILRPFSKKSKLSIFLEQVLLSLFLLYAKLRAIQRYWKLASDHLFFTTYEAFFSKKSDLELVSCFIFCTIFKEKYFSCYILLSDKISLPGCLYFVRFGHYLYCNCLFTKLWRHTFWN